MNHHQPNYPPRSETGFFEKFAKDKKFCLLIIALWILSLWLVWTYSKNQALTNRASEEEHLYPFLNPRLRNFTLEERQARAFATLVPLREKLYELLEDKKENAAFYVEDLNTGAWTGLKEKEEFFPASLLKVPVAIGVMKKIDDGDWTMETTFAVEERFKSQAFGDLWKTANGTPLSVRRLLEEMLQSSDYTATNVLFGNLTEEEREEVYYHIGVLNPEAPIEQEASQPLFRRLTPRNMATFFRALYNATYLKRDSSNYLLETLTHTKFDRLISKDIPSDVKVAHKMAAFYDKSYIDIKNFHDCGIAFVPGHPYLFCYLTRELDPEEAQNLIVGMGDTAYEYFAKAGKE